MECLAVIVARRLALSLIALCAMVPSWLRAAPQAGWWWNPAESGRGFFLEVQGPRMFMSGYFYGDDGKPTWLVSNDAMPDAMSYDGRLLAFRDGQSLLGDYRHPSAPADVGAVSLRFSDDSHGTLTWPGGSIAIQRQGFHHDTAQTFQARTGWWWNPDESGRGFSIEMQGDHMFVGTYMYDAAGNPVWYVADALMQSPTRFSAPLLQFANGQTMAGAYHAPTPPAFVGTLTIEFSAPDVATVTLSDEVTKRGAKASKSITIRPQYVKPVAAQGAPKFWVGSFDLSNLFVDAPYVSIYHVEVASMTWEQDDDIGSGLNAGYPAFYHVASGFAVVSLQQTSPGCSGAGSTSLNLTDGNLTVNTGGLYNGKVTGQVSLAMTITCTDDDGNSASVTLHPTYPIALIFSGALEGGIMKGQQTQQTVAGTTASWSWDFAPKD